MSAVAAGSRLVAFFMEGSAEEVADLRKFVTEPFERQVNLEFRTFRNKFHFLAGVSSFAFSGYMFAIYYFYASANNNNVTYLLLSMLNGTIKGPIPEYYFVIPLAYMAFIVVALFLYPLWKFLEYAGDPLFGHLMVAVLSLLVILIAVKSNHTYFVFFGWGFLVLLVVAAPFCLVKILNTYRTDKDRQAYMLFVASMAALGWGLWLQNSGHWQQMAVLDSPVVVPLLNWKIPLTDPLGFLFALLGFVHDPVEGSLSVASQVPISALTLFVAAGLLFLFAEIRLHKSEVGIQPRFALLAFVLFWAAVFLDVALHWSGAPVLPPELILFNRAFAVLAFAVYLFWRRVAKNGEPVRGADGVFKRACDWAEVEGWKIAAWLLGVLWLATELSYLWPSGFPEQVKYLLCVALLAVPVRKIIGFKHEFDSYLSAYRNAQQLERESYQPPPVIATADETRRALGDD